MLISITPTYLNLPFFIEEIIKKRNHLGGITSVNFTIVLLSTTLIESLLFELIEMEIEKCTHENSIRGRLSIELYERSLKANWRELIKFSSIVFGKEIKNCVDNELWKDIDKLFLLRNQLIHGKSIKTIKEENDIIGKFKYKTQKGLFDFLLERKLVNQNNPEILSSEISDYFWSKTKEFLLIISDQYKNHFNQFLLSSVKKAINNTLGKSN